MKVKQDVVAQDLTGVALYRLATLKKLGRIFECRSYAVLSSNADLVQYHYLINDIW